MQESYGRQWRFAGCEFDELSLQLRVKGRPAELELKPLEVLLQLLLHAGEVVPKDALLESVWPGLNVVDGSLATAISKLRKALGDENSDIILTVPRVGYRLTAPVQPSAAIPYSWATRTTLEAGDAVPGREQWRLTRRLDLSASSEVWLAEHPKTRELRVFKFASDEARLKGLKREVTVARYLRESLGESPEFVRVLEWNLETHPYVLESEYGGANLTEWAQQQGGLEQIPLSVRIFVIAAVAKAVAAAHEAGVLHKDLKPANILVKSQANGGLQIKVADFGSASLVEPARLRALGITNLGLTQTGGPQSLSLTGTLMYLAPEVLAGQSPKAAADVYSLGVMLYQAVVGDFRRPLAPGWEAGIDDPILREDIAEAACGDPARRLKTAAELADRLANLDRRRTERTQREEIARREQIAQRKREEIRARLPWALLAVVIVFGSLITFLMFHRKVSGPTIQVRSVAVVPFQNMGADPKFDFLRFALPDEITTALSYTRPISVRPFATTSKYNTANLDLQKAGNEMGVSAIVTGHFLVEQSQLEVTYEAVDLKDNHVLWRDTFNAPLQSLIDARQKLYGQAQAGLAVALGGARAGWSTTATRPTSEEAYDLYVRSVAVSDNQQATAMLERAVQLDPNFAPIWLELAGHYYTQVHYIRGDDAITRKWLAAQERAASLDPDLPYAQYGLALIHAERGELLEGYRLAAALLRRDQGTFSSNFTISYVLRYAGLAQESASHCEIARSFDRQSGDLRSCAVAFIEIGDYEKAWDYAHLSDYALADALGIDIRLRQGKEKEALQIGSPKIEAWTSYDMLLACAAHKPAAEIAVLASRVKPEDDPETNYFSASHLAYCGQTSAALDMLKRTVQANYCSYPAMDTDPMFASIRSVPEYAEIRSAGMACQNNFLAERAKEQSQ
jgi:serine/threonine protein kinase/DNA-binding winged helix-turn-helix (wHTH) protein